MSYDHNVFVGHYAKCKLKKGAPKQFLHWLLDERDEDTVRDKTDGRVGVEDMKPLRDAHYIFPEFMYDKNEYAYIMLPKFTYLSDIARGDSCAFPIHNREPVDVDTWIELHNLLIKAFDFDQVELMYGAIVEVR